MPTQEQIQKAKQMVKALSDKSLRRRREAVQSEIFAMARIGEQSESAERRLDNLEVAERIMNAELRRRHEEATKVTEEAV
jgi:hypothetical protein